METTQSVATAIQPKDWAVSLDLRDAYFHILIHPYYQHFLHFCHEGRVYQFHALPFGLASAPLIFWTVVKAFVAPFHALGLKLHDWLLCCQCHVTLRRQISLLLQRWQDGWWMEISLSWIHLRLCLRWSHVSSPGLARQDRGPGATVTLPLECHSQGVSSVPGAAQLGCRSSAFRTSVHSIFLPWCPHLSSGDWGGAPSRSFSPSVSPVPPWGGGSRRAAPHGLKVASSWLCLSHYRQQMFFRKMIVVGVGMTYLSYSIWSVASA
jgi:hypothetical protein